MNRGKQRRIRRLDFDLAWQDDAACRGPITAGGIDWHRGELHTIFFPELADRDAATAAITLAKAICRSCCPVMHECRRYAIDAREPDGVWGGLDPQERRREARRNRRKDHHGDH